VLLRFRQHDHAVLLDLRQLLGHAVKADVLRISLVATISSEPAFPRKFSITQSAGGK
jgi:hypothetical protein